MILPSFSERNVELQKLHLRVHRDVHLMAHFKERQKMLSNSVKAQRLALDELMNEKQTWRLRIGQLRVKRDEIRRGIKELSFKAGLLDKPALMLDYDQTCKMLGEHHNEIEHLKDSIQMIEEKLDRISKSRICNRLSYK